MYIILDGRVDFSMNMETSDIILNDAEELGEDLKMRDLTFRLQKFRNSHGISTVKKMEL